MRDCILPTARSNRCGAFDIRRTRRGSGVIRLPAHRFGSLTRARKSSSSLFRANDSRAKIMKIKPIVTIAAIIFLPIAGFAQTPPTPPQPPHPPGHPSGHEKAPKIPVTFIGVETSQVPSVVSEQLGLAKGLGLVVDYVAAES